MEPLITTLTHERSTKGAHLFATKEANQAVTSIYVRKDKMPTAPKEITVTITDS